MAHTPGPPVPLTYDEIRLLLSPIPEPYRLMAGLYYIAGLRIRECVSLRVRDLNIEELQIIEHGDNGNEDRRSTLPAFLLPSLQTQLERVKELWQRDIMNGYGEASMPDALKRKYPDVSRQLDWQYLFPASKLSFIPGTRSVQRHHVEESMLLRLLKAAEQRRKPDGGRVRESDELYQARSTLDTSS